MLLIVVVLSALAGGQHSEKNHREKARYYYLEALMLQVDDKEAEAYELFKKAHKLDPSYAEAASAYGMRRLSLETDSFQSSAKLIESLKLMTPFVEEYPGDYYEAAYYAYLAAHLDTLPEAIRIYEKIDSLFPAKTANLIALSEAQLANHNFDKAIEALQRFEKTEGKSAEISLRKIQYFMQNADTLKALGEARELVEFSPRDARYRILMGNVFSAYNMPDSALECYLQAEKVAPDNGAAKLALAAFYKEKGDSVAYDTKTYEALLSEDFDLEQKTDVLAQYLQRIISDQSAVSRGDYLFSVLRSQYPHEPDVLDLAARYSAAKGNFDDAVEQIGYAIDLRPDNLPYWQQLMQYQIVDEKDKEAIATYRRAAKRFKPTDDMRMLLATAASKSDDLDLAVCVYDSLLKEINPAFSATDSLPDTPFIRNMAYQPLVKAGTLYSILGDLFYSFKKYPESFTAYSNSLRFIPDNPLTLNNYAYFLIEQGVDPEKAYDMSKRAVEADPENPTYLDTYAWILFKRGDVEEALTYQQAAVEKSETQKNVSAELYSHLGDILFFNARPDEALVFWKKALELLPNDAILKKKVKTRQWVE